MEISPELKAAVVKMVIESAPRNIVTQAKYNQAPKTTTPISPASYNGIPIDIFRYFSVDMGKADPKNIEKLAEISVWAFRDGASLGDALLRISQMERNFGQVRFDESRIDKLWNWIRIQKNIEGTEDKSQVEDLKKQQAAFSGGEYERAKITTALPEQV